MSLTILALNLHARLASILALNLHVRLAARLGLPTRGYQRLRECTAEYGPWQQPTPSRLCCVDGSDLVAHVHSLRLVRRERGFIDNQEVGKHNALSGNTAPGRAGGAGGITRKGWCEE